MRARAVCQIHGLSCSRQLGSSHTASPFKGQGAYASKALGLFRGRSCQCQSMAIARKLLKKKRRKSCWVQSINWALRLLSGWSVAWEYRMLFSINKRTMEEVFCAGKWSKKRNGTEQNPSHSWKYQMQLTLYRKNSSSFKAAKILICRLLSSHESSVCVLVSTLSGWTKSIKAIQCNRSSVGQLLLGDRRGQFSDTT